jgi:hypothetical protein
VVTSRMLVATSLPLGVIPPDGSPEAAECERVRAVLNACGGNQSRAARMLGSRATR